MPLQLEDAARRPNEWTSSLTYQSRATSRPTVADLRELAWKARARNHALGVTGMLLYDRGRFFQTLEGSPESLKTLWDSVSRDTRHSDIEILSEHIIPARLFGAWDMLSFHGDVRHDSDIRRAKAAHELTRLVSSLFDLVLD